MNLTQEPKIPPAKTSSWPDKPMNENPFVHSNPNILGGTPVFAGTRVPVQVLFDYLEGGESLDTFLDHFPSVRREQVLAVLQEKFQREDIDWALKLRKPQP